MNTLSTPQALWKGFHWSFFINVQGLLLSLERFEACLLAGNILDAQTELRTATELMLASGASMELAGSFSPEAYQNEVRDSMTPPFVQSPNFSGLMSWEHSFLIRVWKRLRPLFENLPMSLQKEHKEFVLAYIALADSHSAVCEKFGGSEGGSLRFDQVCASDTLVKFKQQRSKLINPNSHYC